MSETPAPQERVSNLPKREEVITDSVRFVGPDDETMELEAIPITCAISVFTSPENHVAGILHLSYGANFSGAKKLAQQAAAEAARLGVDIKDVLVRVFNAGKITEPQLKNAFESIGVPMPRVEVFSETGVRVNKDTGRVSFFNLGPDGETEPNQELPDDEERFLQYQEDFYAQHEQEKDDNL